MNWKDYIEESEQVLDETAQDLDEKLVMKPVVRDGKKIKHWVTNKPGYRVQYDKNHQPREVKISAEEKRKRKLAQKKAALKRQSEMNLLQKKRLKSFDVRDRLHLDYDKENPDLVTARLDGDKVKSDIKGALTQKLNSLKDSIRNRIPKK